MPPITLHSASVIRFADNTSTLPEAADALDYLFGIGFGFDEATRAFSVRAHVLAVPTGLDKTRDRVRETLPDAAADVECECVFEIHDLADFRDDAGAIQIPRTFVAHLMGITLSTARGIFLGAGRSPLLQKAPLPITAPLLVIDRFVVADLHPWIETTPAIPPTEAA